MATTNPKVGSTPKLIVTVTEGGAAKNISSATVKYIYLRKPDGSVMVKTAEFTTNGADGKIEYRCAASDLDMPRKWRIQGYVELGTDVWPTDGEFFEVDENLVEMVLGAAQANGLSTVVGAGVVAA